ncbi:hypothetical protein [Photobacterium sanctipauli]|uniref:hypothetical protein n=1 Tax=Photobacterium sanctipauli TaxID=1342794 RepID=UPI000A919DB6|nr:hypothetical protein [Photobacterium sanctipauli]
MMTQQLKVKDVDMLIEALDECYRRLNAAEMSASDLTQDGFTLMFKSAYQSVADKKH